MVYKISIACVPWISLTHADEKCWVTFEWTEAPNMSWKPEDKREIDHRLIVKFHSQFQKLMKQWNDVTRVKFVKDSNGYFKMELYDSQNRQLQHIYLHCETMMNNDKLTFTRKKLTEDDWHWNRYLHWDFVSNDDGLYTASMQHLPYAK
jgi:hypothetical protein